MLNLKRKKIRFISCIVLLCFLMITLRSTSLVYGNAYDSASDMSFIEDAIDIGVDEGLTEGDDTDTGQDVSLINEGNIDMVSDASLINEGDDDTVLDVNLFNADDIGTGVEDDWEFEDGGPYLYAQYDQTNFDLILKKDEITVYDSTDGISEEESSLIDGSASTKVELGRYDYVLQLKEAAQCSQEGSFELKKQNWKDYWNYQLNEGWGNSVACIYFPTVILKNSSLQAAYLVFKDENKDIVTPAYQEMEKDNKGIRTCVYFGKFFNEGEHYIDGEVQYPEGKTYTWEAIPIDSDYVAKKGNYTFGMGSGDSIGTYSFVKVLYNESASFQAPKGVKLRVFRSGEAHYTPYKVFEPYEIDSSNKDYDVYKFNNLCIGTINYLIGGYVDGEDTGFLKKVGAVNLQSGSNPTFITADAEVRNNLNRVDSGYMEDNIYQNTDDSKFVQLKSGESFDFEAFRVWQSVGSITGNNFVEPDYQYDLIGDSVSLETVGSLGREKMRITGVQPGVSVIKVTYDPMGNTSDSASGNYASAIAPLNTGIIIVEVDGNNDADIKTNIEQTEYDTIYYMSSINGEEQDNQYAGYTFMPTADSEISVRVHDPLHNTEWGQAWTEYEPNQNGSYTVKLKEGRNIIEVSSGQSVQYYVVNARGVQLNIENENNPGKELKVGDTVKLSLKGLSQPIQKMAGIYNPGFPGTCWIQYETERGRVVQSEGVQYDVIVNNDIEFVLTEAGTMKLINGQMHAGHLGSELGTHRKIPAEGMLPNLNASSGSNSPYFSTLPDITLKVTDNQEEQELSQLTHAQLYSLKVNLAKVEKSWNLVSSSWDDLNRTRNMVNKWTSGDNALGILPITVNDDVTMTARYFLQSDVNNTVEITDLASGNEKQVVNALKRGDIAYIEITVSPKNESKGHPQTYTVRAANSVESEYPYLTNIKLSAVNGQADMEYLDGQLQAVAEDIDLGYGFISTRTNYTVHVPYNVDKIILTAEKYNADTIKINGTDVEIETPSEEIQLAEGENPIEVVCGYRGKDITYTISVIRDTEPKEILVSREDGTKLILKTESGKTIQPESNGNYMLSEGEYVYYYSKEGYLTKSGKIEIKEDTTAISLPELQKAEQTFGDVSVRAMAQDRILRDKTTITFKADTLLEKEHDLELQGYVSYNYGGYTALHALIDAFNTGISKVGFFCYKGVLTPKVDINETGLGKEAGWVCEVNGKVCDPATTLVNSGDKIDFYYNSDYSGMKHGWFEQNALTVTEGSNAEMTLLATSVRNDGTPGTGLEGADIRLNGTTVGITDASGKLVIPAEKISEPGMYTITAQKLENGKNILTYTYAIITVKKVDVVPDGGKMTVKFRLIGDAKHNGINSHGKYVTWIATKKMTFTSKSVSVYDVFTKALNQAGLEYAGAENNYVRSIMAPKAYGGYKLAEFTNGKNSGWMYTVNGIHPELGLKDCYVTNGDVIIWHYVDDYKLETSFEGSVPTYPNRWLEAEDVDPPSDGSVIDMSKGNGGSIIEEKSKTSTALVSVEAKVDNNGKATVSIEKAAITEVIKKVNEAARAAEKADGSETAKKVVLEVKGTETAKTIETIIPKESVTELNKSVDIVTLKTSIGEVRFDKEAFATIAKNLDGDLKLTVSKKSEIEVENISEQNRHKLNNRPIFEFKAETGSKSISQFEGNVTLSIPYEKSDNEQKEALIMYWVKESGELLPIASSKYDNGYMIMQTNHWSTYVIGYNEAKFADTTSHWAKSNILYLAARDIIKGKSSESFAPNSQITRAEFVQILANMSGDDLSKYTKSSFDDVSEKVWYAKAVEWAVKNGIAGGTGNDKFSPNANITRQDMSVMISKYVENVEKKTLPDVNKAVKFADNSEIASYAKDSVTAMQKAGIINGVKNNLGSYSFNPRANATRAEATTMIANYIKQQ